MGETHTPIVLSAAQARTLLRARAAGQTQVAVSLDLGLSTAEVVLDHQGVSLPDGQRPAWNVFEEMADSELHCFVLRDSVAERIQAFSASLNRVCSLMPTAGAPTILVAGFSMHRIKDTDPQEDTRQKLRALGKVRGRVLDTCMGLGYTAIGAARTAEHVVTIERDPTVLEVARLNPWSRALFEHPAIEQRMGDMCDLVPQMDDARFSCIIHDPPIFSLAGELYSGALYGELHRVLRPNGRLFHYIGDLASKSGSGTARGVVRRLQQAGFARVVRKPEAGGVVAYK